MKKKKKRFSFSKALDTVMNVSLNALIKWVALFGVAGLLVFITARAHGPVQFIGVIALLIWLKIMYNFKINNKNEKPI